MPGSARAAMPGDSGRAAGSTRIIPPLPAGISILPGRVKPKRRLRRRYIVLLVILALLALGQFRRWYSNYDQSRIDPVVRLALLQHAPKGAHFPVKLWSGPRILELEFTSVAYPKGYGVFPGFGPATTCAMVNVFDPKTGTKDPKFWFGHVTCVRGIAYAIHR